MWPVCFLCALENVEKACVHAAFRQRGHHKTGRNSDGKRIIEYNVPDDGIDIEL